MVRNKCCHSATLCSDLYHKASSRSNGSEGGIPIAALHWMSFKMTAAAQISSPLDWTHFGGNSLHRSLTGNYPAKESAHSDQTCRVNVGGIGPRLALVMRSTLYPVLAAGWAFSH
jgi:hypothetical protein